MSLKLASLTLNAVYLGTTSINKAYLGAQLIYDKTGGGGGITFIGAVSDSGDGVGDRPLVPHANTQAGDIIIGLWGCRETSGGVIDAAFTSKGRIDGYATSGRQEVLVGMKVSGADETGTYANTGNGYKHNCSALITLRGASDILVRDGTPTTGDTITIPTFTPTAGSYILALWQSSYANTITGPSHGTVHVNEQPNDYKMWVEGFLAGATVPALTGNFSSTSNNGGGFIEVLI